MRLVALGTISYDEMMLTIYESSAYKPDISDTLQIEIVSAISSRNCFVERRDSSVLTGEEPKKWAERERGGKNERRWITWKDSSW